MIKSIIWLTKSRLKKASELLTFQRNFRIFRNMHDDKTTSRFQLRWEDRFPIFGEASDYTFFDAHYLYHTAWAARVLSSISPTSHIDISSSLNFCSLVSAFIPFRFYDFRPAPLNLSGLETYAADITRLPFANSSIQSLSCLHVVEHIGLGRYGDSLDPDGDLKAIFELKRVLAKDGHLLFVVPVGLPRIQFNAHRIYAPGQIEDYFHGYRIKQFALIDDKGRFSLPGDHEHAARQKYGCGCWWFVKV